jgi:hypothetical protein
VVIRSRCPRPCSCWPWSPYWSWLGRCSPPSSGLRIGRGPCLGHRWAASWSPLLHSGRGDSRSASPVDHQMTSLSEDAVAVPMLGLVLLRTWPSPAERLVAPVGIPFRLLTPEILLALLSGGFALAGGVAPGARSARSGDRDRRAAEDERRWQSDRRTVYALYLGLASAMLGEIAALPHSCPAAEPITWVTRMSS